MSHQGFGFCEFLSEDDAEYAVKIMNQIKLYGKPIRVNKASYDKKQLDVGANLFIGSLDLAVDENALFDTFTTFGSIAEHPKVRFLPSDCDFGLIRSDRAGSVDRGEQRLWIRLVPRLRRSGYGNREHERTVSGREADHGAIRVQEGWEGREAWNACREVVGESGKVGGHISARIRC